MDLYFQNLEPIIDSVVAASLTVNGTNAANAITYQHGVITPNSGLVTVDGFETIEFTNKAQLLLNGNAGNDHIILDNEFAVTGLTSDITAKGGLGNDTIDIINATADLFIFGDSGNDNINNTLPSTTGLSIGIGGGSGDDQFLIQAGTNTISGGTGNDTAILRAGSTEFSGGDDHDTVIVEGTPLGDVFFHEQVSGNIQVIRGVDTLLDSNPEFERLELHTGAGDDFTTIQHRESTPEVESIPVHLVGDSPTSLDRLVVLDDATGDLILHRRGADGLSGDIGIDFPVTIFDPVYEISYEGIYSVEFSPITDLVNGGTGTDGLGRVVTLDPDTNEINDFLPQATPLGVIEQALIPGNIFPSDDLDYFQVTPAHTGFMRVELTFDEVSLLPGGGLLSFDLFSDTGAPLATATNSGNQAVLGFPCVARETYYLRVNSLVPSTSINNYTLSVANGPFPAPSLVDLAAASDTGQSNSDNYTADNTPTFGIDFDTTDAINNGVQVQDGGAFGTPGVYVFLELTNTSTSATTQVLTSHTAGDLFSATTGVLSDGEYLAKAYYSVTDLTILSGFGPPSESITVTIDTTAPVAPVALDLAADSDSGVFDNDNVTNVDAPNFTGFCEPNTLVRLFDDGVLAGQGQTTSSGLVQLEEVALEDGIHTISAEAEDLAGNISPQSASLTVEIDTTPPRTPYLDLISADDTGESDIDNITSEAMPTLEATIEDLAGPDGHLFADTVRYSIQDRFESLPEQTLVALTALMPNGNYPNLVDLLHLPEPPDLANDGVHNVILKLQDRAGNWSTDFLLEIILDRSCEMLAPFATNTLVYGTPPDPFVSATDGQHEKRIRVTWSAGLGADTYRVFRATQSDFSDAEPVSGFITDLFFDDYTPDPSPPALLSCIGSSTPFNYYYRVYSYSECSGTTLLGEDVGNRQYFHETYYEVLPAATNLIGQQRTLTTSSLAMRLWTANPPEQIDPASIFVVMYAETALVPSNLSVDPVYNNSNTDFWITYTPAALWGLGETIHMTIGVETIHGKPVGPFTAAFYVEGLKSADGAAGIAMPGYADFDSSGLDLSVEANDVVTLNLAAANDLRDALEGGVGDTYQIGPEVPFDTAQRIWLPVPADVDPNTLAVFTFLANSQGGSWAPGNTIEGWMVPDSELIVEVGGTAWYGFLVQHGGIAQLGDADGVAPAQASILPMTQDRPNPKGDMLLLLAALLGIVVISQVQQRRKLRTEQ